MTVTLNEDFRVAPEGHTTLKFNKGDKVDGKIAEMAIRAGKADKPKKRGPKPQYTKPTEPDHEG